MRLLTTMLFICAWVASASVAHSVSVMGPYIEWITTDSAVIVWETEEPSIGTVEFGRNDLGRAVSATEPATLHRITLHNLSADTRYAYRCRWREHVTETFTFRTAPAASASSMRVGVIGGTNRNPEAVKQLVRQLHAEQPNLILHTGDLVDSGASPSGWKSQFFDPFQMLIQHVPLFPVVSPATHGGEEYSMYFSNRNEGGYWHQLYGDLLLIGLNTERAGDPGSEQYVWLRDILNQHRKRWIVVVMNEPMFSIRPNDPVSENRWYWQPLFQQFGVDLVLCGNEPYYHSTFPVGYVRGYPQRGVTYVTAGGGNSVIPTVKPSYTRSRHNSPHYVMLEFEDDRLFVRAVDRNNIAFDSFVLVDQASISPSEFVSFEIMELERDLTNPDNWEKNQRGSEPGIAELRPQIQLNTQFTLPVIGEARWVQQGDWRLSDTNMIRIQPGDLLELDFSALNSSELLPLPRLELFLDVDTTDNYIRGPLRGFRNNRIQISPLRVFPEIEVQVNRSERPLVQDGVISNRIERPATPYSRFFDDATGEEPDQGTVTHWYYDDTHLYISAKMFTPPFHSVKNASYVTGDDTQALRENEHACLLVSIGNDVYEFLVCSNGERLDSLNGDPSWTSAWLSRVQRGQTSDWEMEMAIPLDVFGDDGYPEFIEFVRYDRFAMKSYVMKPSYESSLYSRGSFARASFLD